MLACTLISWNCVAAGSVQATLFSVSAALCASISQVWRLCTYFHLVRKSFDVFNQSPFSVPFFPPLLSADPSHSSASSKSASSPSDASSSSKSSSSSSSEEGDDLQNLNRTKEEEIQRPKSQAKETLERMAEIWDRWLPPKAVDSLRQGKKEQD